MVFKRLFCLSLKLSTRTSKEKVEGWNIELDIGSSRKVGLFFFHLRFTPSVKLGVPFVLVIFAFLCHETIPYFLTLIQI